MQWAMFWRASNVKTSGLAKGSAFSEKICKKTAAPVFFLCLARIKNLLYNIKVYERRDENVFTQALFPAGFFRGEISKRARGGPGARAL